MTGTSANISGLPTMSTVPQILEQFVSSHQADIPFNWTIYDDGERAGVPSTIITVVGDEVLCIREGAIAMEEIDHYLAKESAP